MRSRAGAAVLVALGLVMGACAGDGEPTVAEDPKPVSGDAGGTTTTTAAAAIDVSTIPAKIDEAYINAVLKAFDEIDGKATRIIVQNKKMMPEAVEHLAAIYDQDELQDQLNIWLQQLSEGLEGFKEDGSPPISKVVRTMSASSDCISLEVEEDVSGYVINPGQYTKQFLQLIPLNSSRNRKGINPTAWMIHQAGLRSDGSDPGDLCAD